MKECAIEVIVQFARNPLEFLGISFVEPLIGEQYRASMPPPPLQGLYGWVYRG